MYCNRDEIKVKSMTNFVISVFSATKRIPLGRVSTYTAVARSVGHPNAARAAGNALNKNIQQLVPCHRVIRSDGSVGGFARGTREKIKLLRKEGIVVRDEKVEPRFILRSP